MLQAPETSLIDERPRDRGILQQKETRAGEHSNGATCKELERAKAKAAEQALIVTRREQYFGQTSDTNGHRRRSDLALQLSRRTTGHSLQSDCQRGGTTAWCHQP